MVPNIKKICVIANGCPENRNDGARIKKFLSENGTKVTTNYREADIILFRPCGGFAIFEQEAFGIIKKIQSSMKPSGEIIVCGCLSKTNPGFLDGIHDGLVFGPEDFDSLDKMFRKKVGIQNVYANLLVPNTLSCDIPFLPQEIPAKRGIKRLTKYEPFKSLNKFRKKFKQKKKTIQNESCHHLPISFSTEKTFFIKIATGCYNACSYCSIRIARGKLKSKSIHEIVHEFNEGINKGYKEIALIGTETSSYGIDQGTDIIKLLKTLIRIDGNYKIRLRNFHPSTLINRFSEIKEILSSGKIDFIISAIQSGNNRILKLMKRGYKAEDIKEVFDTIQTDFPYVLIGTQFIAGFPSETDEEFQDTLRLSQNLKLVFVECSPFEPRPGTKAAEMENQIPKEVVNKRLAELRRVSTFIPN